MTGSPGRPFNADLNKEWKILLPAPLAGRVEFALISPVHQKPIYGSRSRLLSALLEWWIAREEGREPPHVPTILELRSESSK